MSTELPKRPSLGQHVPVEGPYVGLRPYDEDQQELFFGRQIESGLLENKVLASPVTVLVAPSGAGKTSLLKAGVLPRLRKLDGDVIFFDAWTTSPLPAIRGAVAETFRSALADDESILELCRRRAEQSERPIILILDQFEQFFVRHEQESDAMGREIAALARSTLDVHVVIVLRQEYLARLDAFRTHFLTVSRTAHQLGPLTLEQAREAICGPLPRFDGRIDDDLINTLVEDVQDCGEAEGLSGAVSSARQISLPFLQIVCSRLWAEALAIKSTHLSTELYDGLGGRDRIVQDYVAKVVEELSPAERLDTARVLQLLAPRAGVKMTYAVQDLAAPSRLDPAQVREVLKHLEKHSIVHVRDNGTVVELFHDVFTRVLRSFIDGEITRAERAQARAKKRRRVLIVAVAGAAISTVLIGSLGIQLMAEPKLLRDGLSDALTKGDCGAIETSLDRLWTKASNDLTGIDRIRWTSPDTIRKDFLQQLEKNSAVAAGCLPPLRVAATLEERGASTVLRYNDSDSTLTAGDGTSRAAIDARIIQSLWRRLTDRAWSDTGLPIAADIDVLADDSLPPSSYVVEVDGRVALRRTIPTRSEVAVVIWSASASLAEAMESFSKSVQFRTRPIKALGKKSLALGMAQSWSTPVWRVLSQHYPLALEIFPGRESTIAFDMLETITEHPELYLTESFTRALLHEKQREAPCLLYAALDRFNACPAEGKPPLSQDDCRQLALDKMLPVVHEVLVEVAKQSQPSGVLTRVLDRLADVPSGAPEASPLAVTRWLKEDAGHGRAPQSIVLSRRRQESWDCPTVDLKLDNIRTAWARASSLIEREKPVRARLGAKVINDVVVGVQLRPEANDVVASVRQQLNQRFGLFFPPIRFVDEPGEQGVGIDIVGKAVAEVKPSAAVLSDLQATLVRAGAERRAALVTTDQTVNPYRFKDFEKLYLYSWLEPRFSRNDLKLLLRGVLTSDTSPEPSIRYAFPWLLGSLVFWETLCEPQDGDCFVRHLAETAQALRTHPESKLAAADPIARGVDALVRDDIERAARKFAVAQRTDPAGASKAFVNAYAGATPAAVRARANALCTVPAPGTTARWGETSALKLSDVLDAHDLLSDDKEAAGRLQLCTLMHQQPTGDGAADATAIKKFIDEQSTRGQTWSVSERYWLALSLVNATTRSPKPLQAQRKEAQRLIQQVFAAGALDPKIASDAFGKLKDACSSPQKDRCLWDLADVVSQELVMGAEPILRLADALLELDCSGTQARLQRISKILELASQRLPQVSSSQRAYWAHFHELRRFWLESQLLMYGGVDAARLSSELEAFRKKVAEHTDLSSEDGLNLDWLALSLEIYVLEHEDREAAIPQLLDQSRARYAQYDFRDFDLKHALRQGDLKKTANLSDAMFTDSSWKNDEHLFVSAMSHLLLADDDFTRNAERLLMRFDHRYRDYIRLMLVWRLAERDPERARLLLEDRLLEIPLHDKPDERLAAGDLGPWRDRLLRYYSDALGGGVSAVGGQGEQRAQAERQALHELVHDSKTFAHADGGKWALAGQPFDGFRCEAYFYDALLQSITGDPTTRQERYRSDLKAVIDSRCFNMYEYTMAQWLHKQTTESLTLDVAPEPVVRGY